jgi:hypothetical protein
MKVVFTYLPIRLKEITEIYLKYSIENLNAQNIRPVIFSDKDYFKETKLSYEWIEFNVDDKYKKPTMWSYPKLKVLSLLSFPFVHLDNDLIVNDFSKLKNIIEIDRLNLGYRHSLNELQKTHFTEIYKRYSDTPLKFNKLNNTCIVATSDYININKAYSDVLNIVDLHYTFFSEKYNGIPPITLNQQYLNLYFDNINYLFSENPSFENMNKNGLCHLAEKNMVSNFVLNKNLI